MFNIRASALAHVDEGELTGAIGRMVPAIIGFLLSFFVVSNYWRAHHRLFRWLSRAMLMLIPVFTRTFTRLARRKTRIAKEAV